jgi:hypothetical protein
MTSNLPDLNFKEKVVLKKQDYDKRIENSKVFNKVNHALI